MRPDTFTPRHVRAARAWLGWSAEGLAYRAGCAVSTVRDFECAARVTSAESLKDMRSAFEAEGIVFTEHGLFHVEKI